MKHILIATLPLFLLQLGKSTASDNLQLELVQVIFRHGDRTPADYENSLDDPNFNSSVYNEWGFGQLTNVGMKREYTLGKMLRDRYNDFLGDEYHPHDVYSRSTIVDRTKMSLQWLLVGLYPPSKSQVWSPELLLMTNHRNYIVNIEPANKDMIFFGSYFCPDYKTAREKVQHSPEIQNIIESYHEEFEYLSEKTGRNITTMEQVTRFHSLLMAKESMNFSRPEWLDNHTMEMITEISGLYLDIASYNNEMKRLAGGPLVRTFIENLNKSELATPPRKIYLYSGHDVNVAGFTRSHGFKIPAIPSFGSAAILEKLKDPTTGKVYVKLFVWTGVSEELIQLDLNNSLGPCPLDVYLKLIEDVIPSDKEMSCLSKIQS